MRVCDGKTKQGGKKFQPGRLYRCPWGLRLCVHDQKFFSPGNDSGDVLVDVVSGTVMNKIPPDIYKEYEDVTDLYCLTEIL